MTALSRVRAADGQQFTIGGRSWTFQVDEDARAAWYECDDCGETARTPDQAEDHVCPPRDCEDCDGTGQIGVERGYFGKWETGSCESCGGTGQVQP